MKKIYKLIKWFGITVGTVLLLIVVIGALFLNLSPQFGGSASDKQIEEYEKIGHFEDGIFINYEEIGLVTLFRRSRR